MVHPMFQKRDSLTPAPNTNAKRQTLDLLSGKKKSFQDVDYKPAAADSKKRCHECANYLKPGEQQSDCAKVISIVVAEGVCDLWQQRNYNEGTAPDKTEVVIQING